MQLPLPLEPISRLLPGCCGNTFPKVVLLLTLGLFFSHSPSSQTAWKQGSCGSFIGRLDRLALRAGTWFIFPIQLHCLGSSQGFQGHLGCGEEVRSPTIRDVLKSKEAAERTRCVSSALLFYTQGLNCYPTGTDPGRDQVHVHCLHLSFLRLIPMVESQWGGKKWSLCWESGSLTIRGWVISGGKTCQDLSLLSCGISALPLSLSCWEDQIIKCL